MPLPRYERLAEEKKRKLLQAATNEFVAKGYEGASLNDILEAAELGKSSYYYYFADKEDLYAAVIEDMFTRLDADTPHPDLEQLEAATFWPAIEAYALAATHSFARNPERLALLRPLQQMWQAPSPRLAPLVAKTGVQYRTGISIGQRLGCVRTDLEVETLIKIVEAADHALDEQLLLKGDLTPERLEAHSKLVVDTLRRLMQPARPQAATPEV